MSLKSAQVTVTVIGRDEIVSGTNVQKDIPVSVQYSAANSYLPGTATNQGNKSAYYMATTTGVLNLDLSTIPCSDDTTGFSHIRELLVVNLSDTYTMNVGNGTTPFAPMFSASTHIAVVQPQGRFLAEKPLGTTGYVVDSSNKILKIDTGANAVPYEVYVIGN